MEEDIATSIHLEEEVLALLEQLVVVTQDVHRHSVTHILTQQLVMVLTIILIMETEEEVMELQEILQEEEEENLIT